MFYSNATEPAPSNAETGTPHRSRAALRKHVARQVILELVLPLTAYYVLRGIGLNAWLALIVSGLLIVPFLAYTAIRERRVDPTALFTLLFIVSGTVMSMITGDPRTLLIRDSWIFGILGLWTLGTLFTQYPLMRTLARTIVTVKIGEAGYREWDARWDTDASFRKDLRIITAVWGFGFTIDAIIRVVFASTLPVDTVPLVNTLQWLVVLAVLLTFHTVYVTRHGLKV